MNKYFRVRNISPALLFLESVLLMFFGILTLVNGDFAFTILRWVSGVSLAIWAFSVFFSLWNEGKKLHGIIYGILLLCAGVVMTFMPRLAQRAAGAIFGNWFVIIGVARGTVCVQSIAQNLSGKVRYGISAVLSLVFGILLLFNPKMYVDKVFVIAGIYLILISVSLFIDCLSEMLLFGKVGNSLKRRVRIPLPLFVTALLPGRVVDEFNKYFKTDDNVIAQSQNEENLKDEEFEIFIHLSDKGASRSGHVDFRYKETVFSYGCYDMKAHKYFNLVSDGTLVIAPFAEYLKHCTEYEGKVLAGFSISLTEKQKKAVMDKIDEISKGLVPWQTDYELALSGKIPQKDFDDAASILVEKTGAKIFKFKEGKFKVYYTISTNCVLLADEILGSAGLDILSVNGIITPGAYYSMLNELFERKNTMVTKRTYYRKKDK